MNLKYQFRTEQHFAKPIDEIFIFFSEAQNLGRITPDFLNFNILTPLPIKMQTGTIIDYRIKLYGIPLFWKTEITRWEPPFLFVDRQLKGPYKAWIHEHRFEAQNGKTIMYDTVDYDIPAGFLTPIVQKYFVQKQIKNIFAYRRKEIERYFAEEHRTNE